MVYLPRGGWVSVRQDLQFLNQASPTQQNEFVTITHLSFMGKFERVSLKRKISPPIKPSNLKEDTNKNLWLETKDIFKRIIKLDPFVKKTKQNWSPKKMVTERIFPCYKTKWNCTVVRKWSFFKKGKYHKTSALIIPEITCSKVVKVSARSLERAAYQDWDSDC